MARSSLRLGVGRRTCPSAAPLDKATLRRKLALAFRYAHPRKCIGAPDEPSDATARRLKCPESNASNQKAFDTKCIRSGGAGFGSFALRSAITRWYGILKASRCRRNNPVELRVSR